MGVANNSESETESREIEDLLKKLTNRVSGELWVINGKTGDRTLLMSCDFDVRDSVDVVFTTDESRVSDSNESYSFNFTEKPGEEVTDVMARKTPPTQAAMEEAFSEVLPPAEPTFEDYLHNSDIDLEDLPLKEQCLVLEHQLDLVSAMLDSFGYPEKSKQPGLFSKLFGNKKVTG